MYGLYIDMKNMFSMVFRLAPSKNACMVSLARIAQKKKALQIKNIPCMDGRGTIMKIKPCFQPSINATEILPIFTARWQLARGSYWPTGVDTSWQSMMLICRPHNCNYIYIIYIYRLLIHVNLLIVFWWIEKLKTNQLSSTWIWEPLSQALCKLSAFQQVPGKL